jgi:hypothetical protein
MTIKNNNIIMNKTAIRTTLLSLMALVLTISACVKGDFDEPPIYIPTVDFSSNTTVAGLKALYQGSLDSISDDIIIKGKVVANDESGNLYKKLVIQDETAGIEILLNKTSLYNEYKLGQMVYVKCKGMYLGDYGGLIQLGYTYESKIGQLPEVLIPDHLYRDSLPGSVPEPVQLDLGADNSAYLSMLVSIDNATFADGGKNTWATTDATTNRTLTSNGKSIIVRTSNYASFALDTIPSGYGKVLGILSSYNGDLQLTIRDTSDVQGFSGEIPVSADFVFPSVGISPVTSIDEKFDAAVASTDISIEGWTNQAAAGSRNWQGKTYLTEKYAQATSYNTTDAENKPWLVTPPVVYSSSLKLSFKSEKAYYVTDQLSVWLLYNYTGDASAATWTQINATLAGASDPDYTWVASGDINLSGYVPAGYTGNVYIGFKYEGNATNTSTFCIDDVYVGTGGGGTGPTTYLDESFATGQGAFTTQNVIGDQVWTWDTYKYMKMSGYYSSASHQNEDWLISPAMDLSSATNASVTFDHTINKGLLANLQTNHTLWVSTNYTGGAPNTATWEQVTITTYPAGNDWVFVNSGSCPLPASVMGQSNVRIAFKYLCSDSESASWEVKNVKVASE